mmetsp:Transcript_104341/g.300722  ORF Transcript_104341/g.300722 Transcript_104341/m.300722 type:complete len:269 (+) Transcript_104341:1270-2076(+)
MMDRAISAAEKPPSIIMYTLAAVVNWSSAAEVATVGRICTDAFPFSTGVLVAHASMLAAPPRTTDVGAFIPSRNAPPTVRERASTAGSEVGFESADVGDSELPVDSRALRKAGGSARQSARFLSAGSWRALRLSAWPSARQNRVMWSLPLLESCPMIPADDEIMPTLGRVAHDSCISLRVRTRELVERAGVGVNVGTALLSARTAGCFQRPVVHEPVGAGGSLISAECSAIPKSDQSCLAVGGSGGMAVAIRFTVVVAAAVATAAVAL